MRLSNTVVGPIQVQQGSNATAPAIEAFGGTGENLLNTETSLLRLTFSSTAPWVSASAGTARPCSGREGNCIPVTLAFTTGSLQPGQYSATITVSDPVAIDAPQKLLVLVTVGPAIADRVNLYVPPNGSDRIRFSTNSPVTTNASTSTGGDWLSVVFRGIGTFDFVRPYEIIATHSGQAAGAYNGQVAIAGTPFNTRTVQVVMNVTTSPIARPAKDSVRLRSHQGAGRRQDVLRIANGGQGTLAVSGVTATTSSGGNWLTAEPVAGANAVTLTFNPEGVQPGVYKGSVSVASNAANSPSVVPVEYELIANAAPIIHVDGVQDNATFAEGDVISRGGSVAAFGEGFTYQAATAASAAPLPTTLAGTRVLVNDVPAPIYFSSFGQVNFQVPYEAATGEGTVRIERDGQRSNASSIRVRPAVPKMLRLQLRAAGLNIPEFRDYFGVAVHGDGTLSLPPEFGVPGTRKTKPGETIVMYALGLGQTDPPAVTGAAATASPLQWVASNSKRVCFGCIVRGGIDQDAIFIGLAPGFVGLYQINVTVPENVPSGDVAVRVLLDESSADYGLISVE